MSNKYKYFKVSSLILEIDVKLSELWVYLSHCRHREKPKTEKGISYSFSALTGANDLFSNLNKRLYNKAMVELEEKGLIIVSDIKDTVVDKGHYQSKQAIRIFEGEKSIQVPKELLDLKLINDMKKEEILAVLELYNEYDPINSLGGIDHSLIQAYSEVSKGVIFLNHKFGEGFNRAIKGKSINTIRDYDEDNIIIDSKRIEDNIEVLLERKLFKFKPVIAEFNLEEEEIIKRKYEIFEGIANFEDEYMNGFSYILTDLEENQKIIYLLEPLYHLDIKPYHEYLEKKSIALDRAILIYRAQDNMTKEGNITTVLYKESLYDFIKDTIEYRDDLLDDKRLFYLYYQLIDIAESFNGNLETVYQIRQKHKEQLDVLLEYKEEEKENIEVDRLRIEEVEDRRCRKESSNELRQIKRNIKKTRKLLEPMFEIEKELKDLIPLWIIEKFYIEYDEIFTVEKIGNIKRTTTTRELKKKEEQR